MRGPSGRRAAAAAQQAVLGHDRQLERGARKPSRRPAWANSTVGSDGRGLAVEEGGLHAGQVELGALGLAAAGPGDDRAVARADQLLQLGLGLAQRARGGVGALGAELVRLVAGDARQPQRRALGRASRPGGPGGRRGGGRPGRGSSPSRPPRGRAARAAAPPRPRRPPARPPARGRAARGSGRPAARRRRRGARRPRVAAAISASSRCSGAELGGGGDLDAVCLLERALGEGGEPGQALDLDVEQLAAHGALLGGGVDVEDVAAHRELAALLDLVDALVAARDQLPARPRRGRAGRPSRSRSRAGAGRGRAPSRRAPRRRPPRPRAARRPAGRRARRCAGRPGAAAAPGGTRSACRAPGRSAPGAARGRP